jgi:hypothetical protein
MKEKTIEAKLHHHNPGRIKKDEYYKIPRQIGTYQMINRREAGPVPYDIYTFKRVQKPRGEKRIKLKLTKYAEGLA